jgi:tetratricopeptide (TPR) repeat protein/predicted Ser/Thr protein kinase
MLANPAGSDSRCDAGSKEPPERIGHYRVLREIGSGGMGVVYLAERDDGEYQQTVAIKVIRRGARDPAFAKLFLRERQILANLEHPNVARLIDGGSTENGQPYYVMEFVDGVPLAEYCFLHSLTLQQKLELFLAIASAVAYAHRKLVIHRDLKPQNVLVGADGAPKLLDFGIAKILAEDAAAETTTSGLLLTPSHASPEQIAGAPLTVATDVYSLGVLLYEMLSGEYPYGEAAGPIGRAIAVLEQPPRPFRELGVDIPPELEKIVFVALRKEPERRYATVDALNEDIRRYLDGYPVYAAGDSLAYRLAKFGKRHRWALAGASAALIALATAGVVTWRAKQAAELRFQQLRGLAHSVVFEIHDAIADLPGSTAARKLLIARSLQYLNALEQDRGNDPALMLDLAQSYKKIGDAIGNAGAANLGDRSGALESYQKARELLVELRQRNPSDTISERWLGFVDEAIAVALPRRENTEILAREQEAVHLFEDVSHKSSGPQALRDLAQAHFELANTTMGSGNYSDALGLWQRTVQDFAKLDALDSHSDLNRRNLALVEKYLAGDYYALGDCRKAIEHDRAAEALDESRIAANLNNQAAQTDLTLDLIEIGSCLDEMGDRKQAIEILDRTVSLRRGIAKRDPRDDRAQELLEIALRTEGAVLAKRGEFVKASGLLNEALFLGAARRRTVADANSLLNLALDHFELGNLYLEGADRPSAGREFRAARTLAAGLPAQTFEDPHERKKIELLPALIAECSRP